MGLLFLLLVGKSSLHGTIEGVGEFGVEVFELGGNALDVMATRGLVVGTALELLAIVVVGSPLYEVCFANETEGTDEGHGEMVHGHQRAHGGKLSFEGEVHEGRNDEVVAVVTKGDFIALEAFGNGEEAIATVSGTTKTYSSLNPHFFALIFLLFTFCLCFDDVEGDAEALGEGAEVVFVALVGYVGHADVGGFNLETGYENALAVGEEFE